MTLPRILLAGDSAVNVEFENRIDVAVNARAIALSAAIGAAHLAGVRDIVPTYRTVTVHFDPLQTDVDRLVEDLRKWIQHTPEPRPDPAPVNVPVSYGGPWGPDLGAVAAFAGCSEAEVVRMHAGRVYRVYMLGFLPGYAYMGMVDPRIAVPRHATPRLHVPGGAVGIAGMQTSVSPMDSPGGWHIIGRTPLRTFDPSRPDPFLLSPGDTVRFVPSDVSADLEARVADDQARKGANTPASPLTSPGPPGIRVRKPGVLSTIQDLGRWGYQHLGVPVGGAMDLASHRLANVLVGNADSAATIEVTLLGPDLEFESETMFAVTGAEFDLRVDDTSAPMNAVCRAPAGARLRFGARRRGARAYLAVAGGIDVPAVFGSRSLHLPSLAAGPTARPLAAGDRLPIGPSRPGQAEAGRSGPALFPLPAGGARLRVVLGPQESHFTERAQAALQTTRYVITAQSNRMGYRLEGAPLEHAGSPDTISDATPPGAIQVPASGQPILLTADRQTTGGYPKIATVITADLSIAGQLAPGDWIEFAVCDREEAVAALRAQHRLLTAEA